MDIDAFHILSGLDPSMIVRPVVRFAVGENLGTPFGREYDHGYIDLTLRLRTYRL